MIVIVSNGKDNSTTMANQLSQDIQNLNLEHQYNENYEVVTVSMGITKRTITYNIEVDELYHEADQALYKAKNNGRNQVVMY